MLRAGLLVLVLGLNAGQAGAAESIGQTVFVKGAVTAQTAGAAPRIIGKESPIYAGDVISTGAKSFGVISLSDGTRMALRADTVFKVESYQAARGEEGALMRLFRGGFRTVTGLIAKAGGERFKVRTPTATIGVRGTDFSVRICDASCQSASLSKSGDARTSRVVGRVAFQRGELAAEVAGGKQRALSLGGPIYTGDLLQTGADAFAVIAFQDESRITLGSASAFKVEVAEYAPGRPAEGRTLLRFLRGTLRAATGLIAKARPQNFNITTPTATIGVRGTGFDLQCLGNCGGRAAGAAATPAPDALYRRLLAALIPAAVAGPSDGLLVSVWSGLVLVDEVPVAVNQAFLFQPGVSPLAVPPPTLPEPRPDGVAVDQRQLFAVETQPELASDTLIVGVNDGHVTVSEAADASAPGSAEVLDLGAGEAALLGGGVDARPRRLDALPEIVRQDPVFQFADPAQAPTLELFQEGAGAEGCFQ